MAEFIVEYSKMSSQFAIALAEQEGLSWEFRIKTLLDIMKR